MKRSGIFVCALALVGAIGAATPPPSGMLPSGTYRYEVHSQGKLTATSTVVISHDPSSVTVKETVKLEGETVRTARALDPTTFATMSWSGLDGASAETVTIASKSATYHHGKSTTTLAAPADAPSAVFDFFVAEFSVLPAMIHATGATRYNEYCLCFGEFQAKAISIMPASAARPAAAQPSDVSIVLGAEGKTATLWYDPQTFILRELDLPREQISYIRI